MSAHHPPGSSTLSVGLSAAVARTTRLAPVATRNHRPKVTRLGASEKSNPRVETLSPDTVAHSANAHSGIAEYGSCEPSPMIQKTMATTNPAGTTMRSIFTTSMRAAKIVRR